MTPVFDNGTIVFWVASRGHHADIGGIAPGSMPPMSKLLADEGAAVIAFKLVQGGVFREAEISTLLTAKPVGGSAESVGTRCLADNLSDLRAQVAANTRGIHLVADLISQYGLKKVQAYMGHILNNAEGAVREMLKAFGRSRVALQKAVAGGTGEDDDAVSVHAMDRLDDGSVIALKIDVDLNTGDAVFDFTGTGEELWGE
jgi:5-oxoprolinase (ATP-hydrolysing)